MRTFLFLWRRQQTTLTTIRTSAMRLKIPAEETSGDGGQQSRATMRQVPERGATNRSRQPRYRLFQRCSRRWLDCRIGYNWYRNSQDRCQCECTWAQSWCTWMQVQVQVPSSLSVSTLTRSRVHRKAGWSSLTLPERLFYSNST